MNLDSNAGDTLLRLNCSAACSPAVEAILPAGTDVNAVVAALNDDIASVLTKHLGEYEVPLDGVFGLTVYHTRTIETPEERGRKWDALLTTTPEEQAEIDRAVAAREQAIDSHPSNGTRGWWSVENYRHRVLVRADSCRAALAASGVDYADLPEWVGVELPDVIEC